MLSFLVGLNASRRQKESSRGRKNKLDVREERDQGLCKGPPVLRGACQSTVHYRQDFIEFWFWSEMDSLREDDGCCVLSTRSEDYWWRAECEDGRQDLVQEGLDIQNFFLARRMAHSYNRHEFQQV